MSKYYVGDIGTIILLDTGVNLVNAGVTFSSIKIKKPDNTELEWIATVYNSNYIKYTIQSGDFDISGRYQFQAYIESPSWTGRGDTVSLDVADKFK